MPGDEQAVYLRSIARITRLIAVFGVAGGVFLAFTKGLHYAGGFLLGSAVSGLSFWRWRKVVESLGTGSKRTGSLRWVLRFVLLAAVAYVIVKYLEVSLVAALLGLLVTAAAVVFEIIYQLLYPGA